MDEELKAEAAQPLLLDMKTSLELNLLPQPVAETLQSVFGATSNVPKSKNTTKMRLSSNICKMFKSVLPKSTPKLKSKSKSEDDFVIIPATPKVISIISVHFHSTFKSNF